MRHFLTFSSCILNLVAFILLLLVTLSGLVVKGVYLFILPWVSEFGNDLRIGVLGFCDTNYAVVTTSNCFGPQRIYTIPISVVEADQLPLSVAGMLDQPLVSALVLHPICAGLAILCSFFSLFSTNRPLSIATLSLSAWNAILATVAFAADVVVVTTAKNRVDDGVFLVYWGAGPWMTLAAAICIWISVMLLSIRAWKYGGNHKPVVGA